MNDSLHTYHKLMILMIRSKRVMMELVEKLGMTPVQGMFLMLFEGHRGQSMHKLSSLMGCDASNITGLVDRLDSQQLIERTVDPNDRRVKLIKLSEKGTECRYAILEALDKAEAADLHRLTPEERASLIRIVDKLTSDTQ